MLTDRTIKLTKPATVDVFLNDGKGLYLRVRPSGSKVWAYRYKNGKATHWLALGDYPDIGLAEARVAAAKLKAGRRQGIDPIEERERAAEAAAALKEAAHAAKVAQAARLKVSDLFDKWMRLELAQRKDAGAEVKRAFNKDVIPVIGELAAADVTRIQIAGILDNVVERGARIVARNLLGDIRQMYGFAFARGLVENDPTAHMKRDDFGKKVERARVLSDEEIRLLTKQLPKAGMQATSVASTWIMLSTCCRVGELSKARWEHVDLKKATWRIPPEDAKNGREHVAHLSPFALKQFEALRKLVVDAATEDGEEVRKPSPWVLPGRYREGHVCLKSLAKQIGDRQRGDKAPMKNRSPLTEALLLPRGKWTPHDLRRTGATLMGTLGVRPDIIEKCLNHVEPNRMIRTYQRHTSDAEKREAWRLLGDRLELLTKAASSKIKIGKFGGWAA